MLYGDLWTLVFQPNNHLSANLRWLLDQVGNPDGKLIFDRVLDFRIVERVAQAVFLAEVFRGGP